MFSLQLASSTTSTGRPLAANLRAEKISMIFIVTIARPTLVELTALVSRLPLHIDVTARLVLLATRARKLMLASQTRAKMVANVSQ